MKRNHFTLSLLALALAACGTAHAADPAPKALTRAHNGTGMSIVPAGEVILHFFMGLPMS